MRKIYRNNLNNFINRFGKLYKEPVEVPKTNKDNACIKCNCVISDGEPFISRGGDTYCCECHAVICEQEREIDYNNRNICLRCNVKSDGPFINDPETRRPICSKCRQDGDSGLEFMVL